MCNLYLMYYTESKHQDFLVCLRTDRRIKEIPESEIRQKLDKTYKNVPKLEHFRPGSQGEDENREPKNLGWSIFDRKFLGDTTLILAFRCVAIFPDYRAKALEIPSFVGDIASVTFDIFGNLVILHRGEYHWDGFTFNR